jgi:hypothetical protein
VDDDLVALARGTGVQVVVQGGLGDQAQGEISGEISGERWSDTR